MENEYRRLLQAVEQALGRSLGSTSDFEYLGMQVFEKTRERLSSSTLMRLWGRRASVSPRKSTLDILARFLGYNDSADFFASVKAAEAASVAAEEVVGAEVAAEVEEDKGEEVREDGEGKSEEVVEDDKSEEVKEDDDTAAPEPKRRAAGWWMAAVLAVLLIAAGAVHLLINKERAPHRILSADEIKNTKIYRIASRHGARGELGVTNHELATTYPLAEHRQCLQPGDFAILQYEGAHYLYSVSDGLFVNFFGQMVDVPLASDGAQLTLTPRDSCFIFSFVWRDTPYTLNLNIGNGTIITDYGIATGDFDEGNQLELCEVGDFDPTEVLQRLAQLKAEYEKAAQTLAGEQAYCIYTQQDAEGRDGKQKHYLAADGRLTDTFSDSCRFVLHRVEGNTLYASPSFRVCRHAEGLGVPEGCRYAFGAIRYGNEQRDVPRGYLEVMDYFSDQIHSQAFFLGSNGCYSIRCSNAALSSCSAGAFWCVVDADGDGSPDIDYSAERQYIWHVEPLGGSR